MAKVTAPMRELLDALLKGTHRTRRLEASTGIREEDWTEHMITSLITRILYYACTLHAAHITQNDHVTKLSCRLVTVLTG